MYGFDIDHIMMGVYLRELGIPHVFEIDDGGHDSGFYLPRLKDGFAYLTNSGGLQKGTEKRTFKTVPEQCRLDTFHTTLARRAI